MANFRVGVLTGGGDTSALNATLYGIVRAAEVRGGEVIGFRRGWAGVLYPDKGYEVEVKKEGKTVMEPLKDVTGEWVDLRSEDIDPYQGGSIILCSRTNLMKIPGSLEDLAARADEFDLDYLVAIGGEDTTGVAYRVVKDDILRRARIMAVPKTIDDDNGKNGPDGKFVDFEHMLNIWTPGYPSAVRNARDFSNAVYSTGVTHERVMLTEAMGRTAGFLPLAMGYTSKADMILLPEVPIHIEEITEQILDRYRQQGFFYGIVSEGVINAATEVEVGKDKSVTDSFGNVKLGGAAKVIAEAAKAHFKANGVHTPYSNGLMPEYVYRGGPPTLLDKQTAIRLGSIAMGSIIEDSGMDGYMAVLMLEGGQAVPKCVPLEEAVTIRDGKVVSRTVPIDPENPEKGFYDPKTRNITPLGIEYVEKIKVSPIEFTPWQGAVNR